MSSRSNGVTNVPVQQVDHLVREPVSLVLELANVPSGRGPSGQFSSSSTSERAMSRAFADACVNRWKNSRFCGVSLSAIGTTYPLYETENQMVQASPAAKQ